MSLVSDSAARIAAFALEADSPWDYLALVGMIGFPVFLIIISERNARHMLEGCLQRLGVRSPEKTVRGAYRRSSPRFWGNLGSILSYEAALAAFVFSGSMPRLAFLAVVASCGVVFLASFVTQAVAFFRIYRSAEQAVKAGRLDPAA